VEYIANNDFLVSVCDKTEKLERWHTT